MRSHFSTFTATPKGILADGLPLTKSMHSFSPQAQRYLARATELLAQVQPEDWERRTPHVWNDAPLLAKAQMLVALASPQPFEKYSPDQPRDYHGRWTSESEDAVGLESADNDVSSDHENSEENGLQNRTLEYHNGTRVIDPNTGEPYPMPDGMDITANIKDAENFDPDAMDADRAASMIYWFSHGGPQDYQRPDGYIPALFGDVNMEYRNITNYNYGAVSAAMGYSLDEALTAAGIFNQIRGNTNLPDMNVGYGIQNIAVHNITHGFQDYINGKWKTQK